MRAHQGCHVRCVGADIDGGFPGLVQHGAARVAPAHDGEAGGLGFFGEFAQFVHLGEGVFAAGVDGEADGGAAEAERVGDGSGDGLVLFGGEAVAAVELEDGGDGAGEGCGAGLDHAERGGVGVEACGQREAEVVVRVVGGGVGGEAAGGAVFEALIDGEDDHLAGSAEGALHEDAGEVRLGAGVVALVFVEDGLDGRRDLHGCPLGRGAAGARGLADGGRAVTLEPGFEMAVGALLTQIEGVGAFREHEGVGRAGLDGGEGGAGLEDDDAAVGGEGFEGAAGLGGAVQGVGFAAGAEGDGDEGAPPGGAGEGGGGGGGEQQDGAAGGEGFAGVGQSVDRDRWGKEHA